MPFKSLAQEGYLHSHPEILGKAGLKEWDAATKSKHLPEHKSMNHPKHGFHETNIKHHADGSHTVHHHHIDPEKSVEHAVPDHEGMMNSMEQNLGPEAPAAGPAPAAPAGAMQ